MITNILISRGAAALRALLGQPPQDQELQTPVDVGDASILGMPPVRSSTVAGATIKFYYKVTDPADLSDLGFTMIAELPDGTKYDLRTRHHTVVVGLPWGGLLLAAKPVRLSFPNQYLDRDDVIRPLTALDVTLHHELYNESEATVKLPAGGYFDTAAFTVPEARGTYRTVRFFATCDIGDARGLVRLFDPLIILVPKRP